MRGLSQVAAGCRGGGGRGLGSQVPVGWRLQEAWIGVLLHEGACLSLCHVKAHGCGSLQVRPCQFPSLMVYVHLWKGAIIGSGVQKELRQGLGGCRRVSGWELCKEHRSLPCQDKLFGSGAVPTADLASLFQSLGISVRML